MSLMFFSLSKMILLLIALSVDAFAASFAYGADKVKIPPLSAVIIAFISDFLLIFSLLLGNLFKAYIPVSVTTAVSFFILFAIGIIKLFDSSIKKKIRDNRFSSKELHISFKHLRFILTIYAKPEEANVTDIEILSPTEALSLGIALSLDSAAAGIGAASSEFPILLTAIMAFVIGIAAVFFGSLIGRGISAKTNFNFSIIGGILLIILALTKLC